MLVSCVLCTHDNRDLLPVAIASYLSQDYAEKELVVVDDGTDGVYDLFQDIPGCSYISLPHGAKNLSVKRNIAVRLARGEVIIHFDSDDWSAPTRVSNQVATLARFPEAQLVGYHTVLCWDELTQLALYYHGLEDYTWGPCLCYYKSFALANPWPEEVSFGEDGPFIKAAQSVSVDGTGQMVVRRHAKNAYEAITLGFGQEAKAAGLGYWRSIPKNYLPASFLSLLA
jgi:glycosyltransferase involved in cell wall biosynthesis